MSSPTSGRKSPRKSPRKSLRKSPRKAHSPRRQSSPRHRRKGSSPKQKRHSMQSASESSLLNPSSTLQNNADSGHLSPERMDDALDTLPIHEPLNTQQFLRSQSSPNMLNDRSDYRIFFGSQKPATTAIGKVADASRLAMSSVPEQHFEYASDSSDEDSAIDRAPPVDGYFADGADVVLGKAGWQTAADPAADDTVRLVLRPLPPSISAAALDHFASGYAHEIMTNDAADGPAVLSSEPVVASEPIRGSATMNSFAVAPTRTEDERLMDLATLHASVEAVKTAPYCRSCRRYLHDFQHEELIELAAYLQKRKHRSGLLSTLGIASSFKGRYFVLLQGHVAYYDDAKDVGRVLPFGVFHLESCIVSEVDASPCDFTISFRDTSYDIRCDTREQMGLWLSRLRAYGVGVAVEASDAYSQIQRHPIYCPMSRSYVDPELFTLAEADGLFSCEFHGSRTALGRNAAEIGGEKWLCLRHSYIAIYESEQDVNVLRVLQLIYVDASSISVMRGFGAAADSERLREDQSDSDIDSDHADTEQQGDVKSSDTSSVPAAAAADVAVSIPTEEEEAIDGMYSFTVTLIPAQQNTDGAAKQKGLTHRIIRSFSNLTASDGAGHGELICRTRDRELYRYWATCLTAQRK